MTDQTECCLHEFRFAIDGSTLRCTKCQLVANLDEALFYVAGLACGRKQAADELRKLAEWCKTASENEKDTSKLASVAFYIASDEALRRANELEGDKP